MSLTDENFGFIMTKIKDRQKHIFTCNDYDDCDTHLTLEAGTTSRMNRVLYYTLGSLAGDAAWLILDTTPEMNGVEALRRLIDRYMHSKQMKSILLLVQIVMAKFNENDFETTFSAWENNIIKFEEVISNSFSLNSVITI